VPGSRHYPRGGWAWVIPTGPTNSSMGAALPVPAKQARRAQGVRPCHRRIARGNKGPHAWPELTCRRDMVMTTRGGESTIWEGRPTWRAWPVAWIGGWLLLPILIGGVLLASVWLRTKSSRWKLTSLRIEAERGWISRRVDTLELWRVRDVEFRQSLVDRLVGISRIVVTAHDGRLPTMEIRGIPGDRSVYDRLMTAVMQARNQRGVVNFNP